MKYLRLALFIYILTTSFANIASAQVLSQNNSEKRTELINKLKENLGIRNRKILHSIDQIDRDSFIPEKFKKYSYTETSVPLSNGSTIPPVSQIVKVLNLADTTDKQKVLIIGNNTGYAAALFSYFYDNVYLIETDITRENMYSSLLKNKYNNITVFYGNEADAFQSYGPFDTIFIHGAVSKVEPSYFDILKSLGEIIFPLESSGGLQQIVKYKKVYSEISITSGDVSFFSPLYLFSN